jgi:hypothetical protein
VSALAALKMALGDRSVITIEDLAAALEGGRAFLWQGGRSACFVAVNDYPNAGEKVAEAGPAAGDMHEILNGIPDMERIARACGCSQAHVTMGRDWSKKLKPLGYEPFSITMRKFL